MRDKLEHKTLAFFESDITFHGNANLKMYLHHLTVTILSLMSVKRNGM